jgi:hypothetical protein
LTPGINFSRLNFAIRRTFFAPISGAKVWQMAQGNFLWMSVDQFQSNFYFIVEQIAAGKNTTF